MVLLPPVSTDPQECKTIAELGVDFLAAGIGNIHGKYPADWLDLNFERLGEIQDVTNGKPLVLHGGSGIPADQIAKAISLGVSKINVNTELQLVFADATRKYVEAGKDLEGKGYDPRKLLKPGCDAMALAHYCVLYSLNMLRSWALEKLRLRSP